MSDPKKVEYGFWSRCLGPHSLSGMRFGAWVKLLAHHGFFVRPGQWPRAAVTTLASLCNSVIAPLENWRVARAPKPAWPGDPVFVVGLWRSGTTHLHHLLSQDDQFATPNQYQVLYPNTFLLTEERGKRLMAGLMPKSRPQDNVEAGWDMPGEDEAALFRMTVFSPLAEAFYSPLTSRFGRYLTFEDVSPRVVRRWQEAMRRFSEKLTLRYPGKRLLYKSPTHTGKVREILQVFPNAKILFIHRHPYEQFVSTKKMLKDIQALYSFQGTPRKDNSSRVIRDVARVVRAYVEHRKNIPPGNLFEIGFEELQAQPIASLEKAYAHLGLGDFERARPRLEAYLASVSGYRKNEYRELEPEVRQMIQDQCGELFAPWGYRF